MLRVFFVASVAAAFLAGCASTPATTEEGAEAKAPKNSPEMICRDETDLGSRTGTKKVCVPAK